MEDPKSTMNQIEKLFRLKDGIAKEGSPFEFNCEVTGYPPPQVSWFKNGICIDKSRQYIMGEYDGQLVLKVEKVQLEDASEYSCKATSPIGIAETIAKLVVKAGSKQILFFKQIVFVLKSNVTEARPRCL